MGVLYAVRKAHNASSNLSDQEARFSPMVLSRILFKPQFDTSTCPLSANHGALESPQKVTILSVSRGNVSLISFGSSTFSYGFSNMDRWSAARENEWSILLEKMSHRSGDIGEILNESPIKTGVTEETSNTLDSRGMRKFSNDIDFCSVDLNPVFGNLMAEDNALFDHKVDFLLV
nr:hypothetical protein [Tanacetum cinerariifolium]